MVSNPNGFYVTLFRNFSIKAYPNMIAAFMVQLAHEIDLGTEVWEVTLCELLCPPRVA